MKKFVYTVRDNSGWFGSDFVGKFDTENAAKRRAKSLNHKTGKSYSVYKINLATTISTWLHTYYTEK